MISRKDFLKSTSLFAGALFVGNFTPGSFLYAADGNIDDAFKKVFGKTDVKTDGKVKITVPTIAESGANVPITGEVNAPVEQVKGIHIFVDKNPDPYALGVQLTSNSGKAYLSGRVKIGKTSGVRVVAEMANGDLIQATSSVKVTVGGCG